jgi:hypothetical protein
MEVREDCALTAEVGGKVYRLCPVGCCQKFLDEKATGETRVSYDLVIIRAGPAGLTAGVFAATLHDDALVLPRDLGGQAVDSTMIDNCMGYSFVTGRAGWLRRGLRTEGLPRMSYTTYSRWRPESALTSVLSIHYSPFPP